MDLSDLQDLQSELDALKKRCEKLEDYANDAWEIIKLFHDVHKGVNTYYPEVAIFLKREIP